MARAAKVLRLIYRLKREEDAALRVTSDLWPPGGKTNRTTKGRNKTGDFPVPHSKTKTKQEEEISIMSRHPRGGHLLTSSSSSSCWNKHTHTSITATSQCNVVVIQWSVFLLFFFLWFFFYDLFELFIDSCTVTRQLSATFLVSSLVRAVSEHFLEMRSLSEHFSGDGVTFRAVSEHFLGGGVNFRAVSEQVSGYWVSCRAVSENFLKMGSLSEQFQKGGGGAALSALWIHFRFDFRANREQFQSRC